MRKGGDMQKLSSDNFRDCRNCMLGALIFSRIYFLKLNFCCTFTHNAQYVNSDANLIPKNGISSNKPSIIDTMHNLYSYPRTPPLSGPDHLPLSPPPSLSGLAGLRNKELRTKLQSPKNVKI